MIEATRILISQIINAYPWCVTLFSFALGFSLMPIVMKVSIKKQLVVKPNKRSSHIGRIPNVGGMNIFSTFFITFLIFAIPPVVFSTFTTTDTNPNSQIALAGFFSIFAVGFIDDMIDISPKSKFMGEFISAFIIVVMANSRLTHFLGLFGISEIDPSHIWLSYLASAFLFVLLTNSINLIDGVDGLATGMGILISLFFGIYFQCAGEYELTQSHMMTASSLTNLSIMAYTLIGALAIFFIYNVFGGSSKNRKRKMFRRKIFMGDSGSLLLGAIIYVFVISFCQYNVSNISVRDVNHFFINASPAVALCALAVPLFDTLRVMITRIKKGNSPFKADKNHAHHLLLSLGMKHWQVTLTLISVDATFILLGVLGKDLHNWELGGLAILLGIAYTFTLWRILDYKKKKKGDC